MKNTQLKDLLKEIRRNNVDGVKKLVAEFGPGVLNRRSDFLYPLGFAAQQGRAAIVSALLDLGVNPNQCDASTTPPICDAAQAGRTDVVRILLDRGARPDDMGCGRETPLHLAIGGGHVAVVELLVAAGSSVQRTNPEGRTPLEYAAHEGHPKIVEVLLRGGASAGARIEAIREAAEKRSAQRRRIAKWAKDKSGEALFYAAAKGETMEVERLLRAGANPNGVTKKRQHVALCASAGWGRIEIVRLLLAAGAEVNLQEETGETALYAAVSRGHDDIVELLLASGADPNLSPRHRTILEEAISTGQPAMVRLLAGAGVALRGSTAKEAESAAAAEHIEIDQQMSALDR